MFKNIVLSLFVIVAFISCSKKEGVGGSSSIKGVVMVQDVSIAGKLLNSKYVAAKENVFIEYGAGPDGDKIETNTAGVYTFPYLIEGNYTIYCYSDDSLGGTSKVSKIKKISLSGSMAVVDTIVIYKVLDFNDGDNSVVGKIMEKEYYNGTTTIKDTLTAQDKDVYIREISNPSNISGVIDRVQSAYDGTYCFTKLIPGTYEVYVYSENALSKRDDVVRCTVQVVGRKQITIAPLMYIANY